MATPGQLTITLGDLSITLSQWQGRPLTRVQLGNHTLSDSGTLISSAPSFEPRNRWQGNCWIDNEQYATLRAIWTRYEDALRSSGSGYILTVEDCTELFTEVGSRTRGIVSGGSETTQGTPAVTEYYATFNAVFDSKPVISGGKAFADVSRNEYLVTINLVETDTKTAP